ncbi:hypothetical protein RI367_005977 [Sorochytrium milnesiophthora]
MTSASLTALDAAAPLPSPDAHVDLVVTPPNLNIFVHLLWAIENTFQALGAHPASPSAAAQDAASADSAFLLNTYFARAENRYWRWLSMLHSLARSGNTDNVPVPPFDVLIIWLAHMQQPYNYAEDTTRLFGKEILSMRVPLEAIQDVLSRGQDYVDPDSQAQWELHTEGKEPYVLSIGTVGAHHPTWVHAPFSYICPFCTHPLVLKPERFLQLKTPGSHGLACAVCNRQLNAATVSSKRLAEDIAQFQSQRTALAGTLINRRTGQFSRANSENDCERICQHPSIPTLLTVIQDTPLSPQANPWSTVRQFLDRIVTSSSSAIRADTADAIASCYQDNISPFSVDLVQCAKDLRQTHRDILYTVGWRTETLTQSILNHAPVRYHQFVQMMILEAGRDNAVATTTTTSRISPRKQEQQRATSRLLPTLEIDLCLHFHMCFPLRFREFYINRIGKVYYHVEVTDKAQMHEQLVYTSAAWQTHFHTAYCVGAPAAAELAPPEKQRWKTLRRIASMLTMPTNKQSNINTPPPSPRKLQRNGDDVIPAAISRKLSTVSVSQSFVLQRQLRQQSQDWDMPSRSLDLPRRRIPDQFLKSGLAMASPTFAHRNDDDDDRASIKSNKSILNTSLLGLSRRSFALFRGGNGGSPSPSASSLLSPKMLLPKRKGIPQYNCYPTQLQLEAGPTTPTRLQPISAVEDEDDNDDPRMPATPLSPISSHSADSMDGPHNHHYRHHEDKENTTPVANAAVSSVTAAMVFEASAVLRPARIPRPVVVDPHFVVG